MLKEVLKMALKDAKEKIEGIPSLLVQACTKEEAETLKAALKEVGASASII